jgi:hypothetical protein
VEVGGRVVADASGRAKCEQPCHELALPRIRGRDPRIDARRNTDEDPTPDQLVEPATRDARGAELPDRQDAVLAGGER